MYNTYTYRHTQIYIYSIFTKIYEVDYHYSLHFKHKETEVHKG